MIFEKDLPYTENGRWYRVFIESKDTEIKITNSDIPVEIVNDKVLKLPKDFICIDEKYEYHSVEGQGTSYQCLTNLAIFNDGSQGLDLFPAEYFDYLTVYVYGHY